MQFKLFSILALAAATFVVADEAADKRRDLQDELQNIGDDVASDVKSNIAALKTVLGDVPGDVGSALLTAIPQPTGTDVQAHFRSVASEVTAAEPPAWFTGLPENAKSYMSSKASQLQTALPTESPTGNYAAARPTGAIMGSIAGAAGVLGLAVML
ncbi:hypothetical protein AJ79_00312 [Helicocarpus griseus UAMH5409]|uniref:Uncharacterized protein n=1 Tax=Helicocarpus griseus UAMH5409 TaxID=1447875 RepID=A0A2B7YBX5_9EURO|nr:hypothetical protein AJ79_00312 [Helicocarpus griseus UAMH5409]